MRLWWRARASSIHDTAQNKYSYIIYVCSVLQLCAAFVYTGWGEVPVYYHVKFIASSKVRFSICLYSSSWYQIRTEGHVYKMELALKQLLCHSKTLQWILIWKNVTWSQSFITSVNADNTIQYNTIQYNTPIYVNYSALTCYWKWNCIIFAPGAEVSHNQYSVWWGGH
jgi:hypothetical protein